MKLFIAEKPAVANDIVKALGGNFTRHDGWFESDNAIVTNCFGHIIESQPPENYNPEYKALMNPLMILVKIIKLRWIHILSYDQMVSRKINNQTTRCANSIFYTTLFTNSAPNYT